MGSLVTEISWPSTQPQDRQSRIHNHHISLRDRIKELQSRSQGKHPKAENGKQEPTKAAAWAVFQHHGGGGVGHGHTLGMAVRRATRFKIEAQMKHEAPHRSVSETGAVSWDAGSTLFDSFELDALLKTLDQATQPAAGSHQDRTDDETDESGAMVIYSPNHGNGRQTQVQSPLPPQRKTSQLQSQRSLPFRRESADDCRLDTVDEMRPLKAALGEGSGHRPVSYNLAGNVKLDDLYNRGRDDAEENSASVFASMLHRNSRRSFDSSTLGKNSKGVSNNPHQNQNRWKKMLHTLHLDGSNGLFQGFQKFHAQVAPHDSQKNLENKGRGRRSVYGGASPGASPSQGHRFLSKEQCDAHFDRNQVHISKDVHLPSEKDEHSRQPSNFWKLGFKSVIKQPFARQGQPVSPKEGPDPEQPPHRSPQQKAPDPEPPRKSPKHKAADLRSAWFSLTANLRPQRHDREPEQKSKLGRQRHSFQGGDAPALEAVSLHEHHHHYQHHHHHHHVQRDGEDYEMTIQAISQRVPRNSFEEKARRLAIEDYGGLKNARKSLDTSDRFRF